MYKKENGQMTRTEQKARYNKENYKRIVWEAKPEYAKKLEYIANTMNTSKAKVLEKCVDMLYNDLWLNE